MGDAEIFGGGVFVMLWLVTFFGYSWYQLQKGYEGKAPSVIEGGPPLEPKARVA